MAKTKKARVYRRWLRFLKGCSDDEVDDLYRVLGGLRGPDNRNRVVKEWSRWIRGLMFDRTLPCADLPFYEALPRLRHSHYEYHVKLALNVLAKWGVVGGGKQ